MPVTERVLEVQSDEVHLVCNALMPDDPRGTVVLLHGIPSIAPPDPEDVGYPGLARAFVDRGWSAAWGDMRGARGAEGFFSIEGWVSDAAAVVRAARAVTGEGGFLALVGSSAGGVVSAEAVRRGAPVDALAVLAAPAAWVSFAADPRAGVARIVEEAGMPVAPEVVDDPTSWAGEFDRITTVAAIAEVSVPILIVHGTADDVVPVEHAREIARRAPDAEVAIIDGALHQLRRDERAVDVVMEWLDRVAPR